VRRDICLAEWDPRALASSGGECGGGSDDNADDEEKWELWKCRVEFEERIVYFTMARILKGSLPSIVFNLRYLTDIPYQIPR
jgi:hypothetical protein